MDEDGLAEQFEEHRVYLRSVARRMLGSAAEADDAVQETWLRLSRADAGDVANLRAWLTTVTTRVCLNILRARNARREEPLDAVLPDPFVVRPVATATVAGAAAGPDPASDPATAAELSDAVGLAMLVVLDTLDPAERVAFVLHDMFAVPFEEIAPMVDRSPAAARQLASRARRRVRGSQSPASDPARERAVVDAFFAAAREGDLPRLVGILDPDVVLRADGGPRRRSATAVVHGAAAVAARTQQFRDPAAVLRPVLVNGNPGVVVLAKGKPVSVLGFTVVAGRITAIEALGDPDRLAALNL
jgi:RNA polymerase sigma-70 factor, ECF subfamily